MILSIFNSSRIFAFIFFLFFLLPFVSSIFLNNFVGVVSEDTRLKSFYKNSKDIEIISLGTSHSLGFHFPSMGLNGYSFYGPGMDIENSLLKLKFIFPHTQNLKCVVLPFDQASIYDSMKLDPVGRKKSLAYTPSIKNIFDHNIYDLHDVVLSWLYNNNNSYMISIHDARKAIKRQFRKYVGKENSEQSECSHKTERNRSDQLGIRFGYRRVAAPAQCLSQFAVSTSNSHLSRLKKLEPDKNIIKEKNIQYIQNIANLLSENNGFLFLISTPKFVEYRQLMKNFSENDNNELNNYFSNLENVEILNYENFFDSHQVDQFNDVFYDDDHLALKGAVEFSKALAAEMQRCKI